MPCCQCFIRSWQRWYPDQHDSFKIPTEDVDDEKFKQTNLEGFLWDKWDKTTNAKMKDENGKTVDTDRGRYYSFMHRLRRAMLISMWMHICLFFFSFAVVGFKSSLLNFICASWCYSTYLNCRPG